jgi:predicted aminopeptidase
MKTKTLLLMCVIAAVALGGCSYAEFYWQGVTGQVDLLARAKPISEVVATTSDAALKERLTKVQQIRSFASHELGLPDNRTYTRYSDLGRAFVVWNVFATPELSLHPREWCFPIAGCVSYRGYFSEAEAKQEAERLRAGGDDVYMSGVPAYSTLGYFEDPVLSTFVSFREVELARLIFHELAHQIVYVKDDSSFNESFAVSVEEEGLHRWLDAQRAVRTPAEMARLTEDAANAQRLRADFRSLMTETREHLALVYASKTSEADKRARKAAEFAAMRTEYEKLKTAWGGVPAYDRWFASGANNAGIAAAGLYNDRVPQFAALLATEHGDLPRFYARVKELAALPKSEREAVLARVAAGVRSASLR